MNVCEPNVFKNESGEIKGSWPFFFFQAAAAGISVSSKLT